LHSLFDFCHRFHEVNSPLAVDAKILLTSLLPQFPGKENNS
jgi:hypothetical protein